MIAGKDELRAAIRSRRASRSDDELAAWGVLLAAHADAIPGSTLTAFIGVRGEVPTLPLLDALVARGTEVLLPVVLEHGVLDWARYEGAASLAPAAMGLLEPTGPRLGREAIARAETVLAPAVAVDVTGSRLGQGGGFYDRSLPYATGLIVAVVADDEVVERVPIEPHDRLVDAMLTPSAGLVRLPRAV